MKQSIYYFIDKFQKNEIEKLNRKISIVYRNYKKKPDIDEIKSLVRFCKNQFRKVYISNNLKIALNYNFDGVYIPSFNKLVKYKNLSKKNFELIGSAHNIIEVFNKKNQGCSKIFLSPLFKNKKNKYFLDVIKFNLIKLNYLNDFISLGGIDSSNIRREKMCKSAGVASISWVKKNGPSINTGPF